MREGIAEERGRGMSAERYSQVYVVQSVLVMAFALRERCVPALQK
jgi:hypothetical protein